MKNIAFIYNPQAGRGNVGENLSDIIQILADDNFLSVVPTKRKNHCSEYIKETGEKFDSVVVAGGDGTVNEAFNALMCIEKEKRPSLGYIPIGTTNDFATSCAIPHDVKSAAQIAVGKGEMLIDAGKFNDKYFSYIAAFGAFTSVAYDTPRNQKNLFGHVAYVIEGIKSLGSIKPYAIKLEMKDQTIDGEFIFGMAANSTSVGGMRLDKMSIDLSDGLFEVMLVKKIKSTQINGLLTDLRMGKEESEYYYFFKTDKLNIYTHEDLAWTLDGEYGGTTTEAVIENVREAIKIKVEK